MEEIITEFQSESKELVGQLIEILEEIEGDHTQLLRLEEYGQKVDRIMGTAKSLALALPEIKEPLEIIGSYCEFCKLVSYRTAKIPNNEELFNVVVATLLDATEMLQKMINGLNGPNQANIRSLLNTTFLDRLRWIAQRVAPDSGPQAGKIDIAAILKSLGG